MFDCELNELNYFYSSQIYKFYYLEKRDGESTK